MKIRLLAAVALAAGTLSLTTPVAQATTAPAPYCGATIAKPGGGYWKCTFDDEFSGTAIDRTKWMVQTTYATGFHSGQECMVDSPKNVSVSSGTLKLTARKEASKFLCQKPGADYTTQYTSGSVSGWGKFAQTFGRFEIRAKFPAATISGLQSALWMRPQYPTTTSFPASGEIDIAEAYSKYPDRAIPYLHYSIANYDPTITNSNCIVGSIADFHTYTAVWTKTGIAITYDGKLCTLHYWNPKYPAISPAPFDKPFVLYLTQALGVGVNGFRPYATPLPATSQIDYVRIWS
jgi:beta-glucanase (GH16 family)